VSHWGFYLTTLSNSFDLFSSEIYTQYDYETLFQYDTLSFYTPHLVSVDLYINVLGTDENMAAGHIIFLNGASSSGKSSIAKVLQAMMDEPCIHLCIDDYLSAFQDDLWKKPEIVRPRWGDIIRGFHASAAAIARAGILVIIDDVLEEEPPWVESLIELFDGIKVMFVGVYCPLAELERRELERKNRRPGMARLQFEQVHAQALYDIEVDTSMLSPEECANRILACWKIPQRPTAFAQLKTRHPRETDT
jgi:chloramphenicol 3-O phosphotransferase